MKRSHVLGAVCISLLLLGPTVEASVLDSFTAASPMLATSVPFTADDSIQIDFGILGGDRGFGLIQRSESGTQSAEVSGGVLIYDGSGLTGGIASDASGVNLIYDGDPLSGGFGLSDLLAADLTNGGVDAAFRLSFSYNLEPLQINLGIRTGLDISGVDIVVPVFTTPTFIDIPFTDFGAGADFSNADNLALVMRTWKGGFELNSFETKVPAPPALFLFGTGLIGLIGITRRKKV